MSAKPDYYDVLGVERTAGSDQIRKAYRDLARRHHPDVSREPDATERFQQINEAYEVLRDEEKRANYDRYGHDGPGTPFGAGFDDFGGIGDVFDAFFGGGRRSRPGAAQPGTDARVQVDLEFLDSVFGVETDVNYQRLEPCGTCAGNGAAPAPVPAPAEPAEVRDKCSELSGQSSVSSSTSRPATGAAGRGRLSKANVRRVQGSVWSAFPWSARCGCPRDFSREPNCD